MQRSDLIVIDICETKHSSLPQVLRGNTEKEEEREKNIQHYIGVCNIHKNKTTIHIILV